ncbi:hypothetical protein pb186bvf_014698 [Paramecium bursaria]
MKPNENNLHIQQQQFSKLQKQNKIQDIETKYFQSIISQNNWSQQQSNSRLNQELLLIQSHKLEAIISFEIEIIDQPKSKQINQCAEIAVRSLEQSKQYSIYLNNFFMQQRLCSKLIHEVQI